ncbi:molybdopterin-binding protein [Pararhodobacter oceanensis]|uniref:Molybdopterin biosynthesis protein n=1 Tax=Pararhodobacter oceanensis TaxID=2172121 RepID=A0A2T8HXA5_9RHOB|nr:molybdopterin-binding protein [Pararhodobacter oceanensis]PVH30060.1 molybdopterin biosynthesis protein [Pararhodobacter oceanensis]
MDFGTVSLAQAEGAILAHSLAVTTGRLRKGLTLSAADIAALREAGYSHVTVARLGESDLHEDAAALEVARALVPDPTSVGLSLQEVGTGRVNILATAAGLAMVEAARIHAVNAVDPAITVSTVAPYYRMEPSGMVATVKIIPYGVDKASVSKAGAAAQAALKLARPQVRHAVLIETLTTAPAGKGHRITEDRLARFGVTLAAPCAVPHKEAPLAEAIAQARATSPDLILILTGSATSDIRDTAPAALRRAGGRVEHFGMPVDPGNLLFVGEINGTPVLGMPGSAKSPVMNGVDLVLEWLICGIAVNAAEIQRMGVGGLLKEIPSRPRPRAKRDTR